MAEGGPTGVNRSRVRIIGLVKVAVGFGLFYGIGLLWNAFPGVPEVIKGTAVSVASLLPLGLIMDGWMALLWGKGIWTLRSEYEAGGGTARGLNLLQIFVSFLLLAATVAGGFALFNLANGQ
jgi:hypothetical protein